MNLFRSPWKLILPLVWIALAGDAPSKEPGKTVPGNRPGVASSPKSPPSPRAGARPMPVSTAGRTATGAAAATGAAGVSAPTIAAAAALRLPTVYAPTRPRVAVNRYQWKTNIVTTVFWVGEGRTAVSEAVNYHSSWDPKWQINFGGFDDPDPASRAWDFRPKAFEPGQNPFYIALPFNDLTNKGLSATVIPWHQGHPNRGTSSSVCKGRWLAIRFGKKICYAQWEDCGPFTTDDWAYVFGSSPQPKPNINNGAGLDVSPAVRDYLGIVSGVRCDWRFCDESEVPDGPWRKFGSNNPFAKSKETELAARLKRAEELERQREAWLRTSIQSGAGLLSAAPGRATSLVAAR